MPPLLGVVMTCVPGLWRHDPFSAMVISFYNVMVGQWPCFFSGFSTKAPGVVGYLAGALCFFPTVLFLENIGKLSAKAGSFFLLCTGFTAT